ncbi:MAG: hypothetical protein RLZZ46_1059 [Bacteroidota bacterium]|jgi:uncharacterized protein involved in exopolysaccharide biosynthesis
MQEKNTPTQVFNSINILELIYRWRRPLAYTGIFAAVISTLTAFIITPKFKATVIMFPTQTNSISKALLNENTAGKEDILKFGEEEEAEQMLQILNSDEIRNRICSKYKLAEHYRIDTTDKFRNTLLAKEYESNINFERTEFMSVKITVMDTDPTMAANMCNDIAALVDSVKNRMQRERALQGLHIVERSFNDQKAFIRSLEDSLSKLRALGINDYETQAQAFNEQYAMAISKGNQTGAALLEEKLRILSQYGGAYVSLREKLEHEIKQLSLVKAKYEEARVDAEQIISAKFIVNNAFKAEKKSYPIRWLVIVVGTISALLFSLLILMFYENLMNIRKSQL